MASSGVDKVILGLNRDDDQGPAFERHRGRVPFDMDKHNTMEKAYGHLIDFMGIKKQVEKFGFGALFRLEKIERKTENFAVVTKAQLEMELLFLVGSATSELICFVLLFRILSSKRARVVECPNEPFLIK